MLRGWHGWHGWRRRFYDALDRFEALVDAPQNAIDLRLQGGEVVVTDNWRVMHSRRSFVGDRHFLGAYVDWDAMRGVWRRSSRACAAVDANPERQAAGAPRARSGQAP